MSVDVINDGTTFSGKFVANDGTVKDQLLLQNKLILVKKINKDKLMIPKNSNKESLSFYFGRSK